MFEVVPLLGRGSLSFLDPRSLSDVYYQSVRFNVTPTNCPPNIFGS